MSISPGKARPRTSTRFNRKSSAALHSVSKVFLVRESLPKNPALGTVDAETSLFPAFRRWMFYKQSPDRRILSMALASPTRPASRRSFFSGKTRYSLFSLIHLIFNGNTDAASWRYFVRDFRSGTSGNWRADHFSPYRLIKQVFLTTNSSSWLRGRPGLFVQLEVVINWYKRKVYLEQECFNHRNHWHFNQAPYDQRHTGCVAFLLRGVLHVFAHQ